VIFLVVVVCMICASDPAPPAASQLTTPLGQVIH